MERPKGRRPKDDDECQDRACKEMKNNMRNWLVTGPTRPDCPADRETLGRSTWTLLHTVAARYPMRPNAEDKKNMEEFVRLMSILYPCSDCAREFRKDLKELPPKVDSRKELAQWFCDMHNRVNVKLHKPKFDCSKVDERWRTGWKDGSCT